MLYVYLLPPDDSLTLQAVQHAVATVRWFWRGGLLDYLGVPLSVLVQIRHDPSYPSENEKRMAGLQYYIENVPGVSWGRIAGVLWYMGEQQALEEVRQYLPPKRGKYNHAYLQPHTKCSYWYKCACVYLFISIQYCSDVYAIMV